MIPDNILQYHQQRLKDYFIPPEWHPKDATLISWPVRDDIWGSHNDAVARAYCDVAYAIHQHHKVVIIADPSVYNEAKAYIDGHGGFCASNIDILLCPLDDSWIRDNGPIFAIPHSHENHQQNNKNHAQKPVGLDFEFNEWGLLSFPKDNDKNLKDRGAAQHICASQYFGFESIKIPMILEGGSVHFNGRGLVMTTESCLLNANRNGWEKSKIDQYLRFYLGQGHADQNKATVIWLPHGLDRDLTDGHVDNIACFIDDHRIFHCLCLDKSDENYDITHKNMDYLYDDFIPFYEQEHGIKIHVDALCLPPKTLSGKGRFGEERLTLSYMNFYRINKDMVIMPQFGQDTNFLEQAGLAHMKDRLQETDELAKQDMKKAMPDVVIQTVNALPVLFGGGGIHCITQQVPMHAISHPSKMV
jgi:agmatine deiminase